MTGPVILHADLVALFHGGLWRGALITGPSGVGKSDLALRCVDAGFSLVADDRVEVWTSAGVVYGRAPEPLAGLIEVRGQGVVPQSFHDFARIVLACECGATAPERMPDPARLTLLGTAIPQIPISPLESSAPAKLRRALITLGQAVQQA